MDNIAIKLSVDSAEAASSIKDLKQLIKDAKNEALKFEEGTAEFNHFANVAGVAKAKLNDVGEALNRLDPEKRAHAYSQLGGVMLGAFSAAQGAAALFGAKSEDVEKALLKVQSAMALLQGFQAIKDGSKAMQVLSVDIGSAIKSLGAMKTAIIATGIGALVVAIGLLAANWDKVKAAMNPVLAAQQKSIDLAQESYDLQVKRNELIDVESKIMKLNGENEEAILTWKLQQLDNEKAKLIDLIKAEAMRLTLLENQQSNLKKVTDSALFKLTTGIGSGWLVNKVFGNEGEVEDAKKGLDDLTTSFTQLSGKVVDIKLQLKDLNEKKTDNTSDVSVDYADKNVQKLETINTAFNDSITSAGDAVLNSMHKMDTTSQTITEGEKKRAKALRDYKVNLAFDALNVISSFTDLFGKKNEASAKKAFQIHKQIAAAQAVISTYKGANEIFSAAAANPATVLFPAQPFIAAGLAIAAGIANVAKIESQQFGGSSSGGGGFSSGSFSSNAPTTTFQQPTTNLNQQNQTPVIIQNHIVESELTSAQTKVKFIENASVIH